MIFRLHTTWTSRACRNWPARHFWTWLGAKHKRSSRGRSNFLCIPFKCWNHISLKLQHCCKQTPNFITNSNVHLVLLLLLIWHVFFMIFCLLSLHLQKDCVSCMESRSVSNIYIYIYIDLLSIYQMVEKFVRYFLMVKIIYYIKIIYRYANIDWY